MTRPIALAAGGTGGHVFPAQALASELQRRGRTVILITDKRGAGYEKAFPGVGIHRISAGTFAGRGVMGKARALFGIAAGYLAAGSLLRKLDPAVIVGFGGYPSLPTMLAAGRKRVTLLHEQNAHLGRVNRLLAPRVSAIATSFPQVSGLGQQEMAKVAVTGNPVREAITAVREVPYTSPNGEGPIRILVLGGSQGATVFSEILPEALTQLPETLRKRLRITQQCRAEDLDRVRAAYAGAGIAADLASFIEDVPALLAAAHLVVSRAGASTVSELAVSGRPAILVPYPHATDDHQTANAKALVNAGGAWLMPQPKFTASACRQSLQALLGDAHTLAEMADGSRSMGRPRAAADLADLVERLAPGNGAFEPANDTHGGGRAAA
jgi:UDP-N-acetylglucosamine--N-acetylmuramyl-(pentapeptide) pyrophosphoryl-undecaprenol N-acetylglucosamine transferase